MVADERESTKRDGKINIEKITGEFRDKELSWQEV